MKKIFILILTLVMGFIAESQTPQYWNRLPAAGANVFPFGINPATGKKVQWCVAAGEFNQPTPAPAGNINAIWFRPNAAGTTTFTTLTVKFATVSTSTFIPGIGQWYAGPMTTVLSQNTTITAASALQWVSVPLTTPYPYDPTMNLIIEVSQCGYTGPGFAINHDVIDVAPNYRRQYSDAASVCGATVLPTGGQFNIPAIGLNFSGAAAGPTVTINQAAAQPDPTGTSPINFTAVFSAPVTGFATGDVALSGTAGATTGTVTGGPTTYNIAVSGMTGSGTVIANIPAGVCIDATSAPNQASTSTDNTVTYNSPPPVACTTFVGNISAADPTNGFRSFRDAVPSTCAVPGPCGAQIAGSFNYKILTWTNPVASPQCVTVTYSTTSANFNFVTAFNGPVNLANLCTNYLGDPGSSAIPGTPITWSFTAPASATINFYVANVLAGQTADYTIDVSAPICSAGGPCTITRTSAAGTDNQTRCVNQTITNITYATTGATGATFTGLPAGVTGVWAANVVTISGTPTAAGVFNYIVTLTGCAATTATGTITVVANPAIGILEDPTGPLCAGDPKLLTAILGQPLVSSCFTQSTSPTPVAGSVACNAGGITTDNSYWRVYPLTPYGLPGPLTINSVRFGIELNQNGPLNAVVNFYLQTGAAFPGGTRTLIRTQPISIPNASLTVFTAPVTPVTVNPTDVIVIELFTPGTAVSRFFIGSNTAPQTGTSYISAAACAIATPTDLAAIGFPNMHIILDFCGTTGGGGSPIPPGWTYLWSPAAGLSSTTTNPVAASPMVTTTYSVLVTNLTGCQGSASVPVTVYLRPAVLTQPANVSLCAGSSASFSITATGQAITYQWQESTNGGGTYNNLTNTPPYSGVNTATLTINPTTFSMNGNRYRCVVSGACSPAATSNAAILTVVALPNVTVTPGGIVCGGVAGISGLTLTASGANTYTWSPATGLYTNATATNAYVAGGNVNPVYAAPTTQTAYTVTGTSTATGCSNTATVVVNATPPPPTVTPNPVSMCLGDPPVKLNSVSSVPGTCTVNSGAMNLLIPDANAANTQNFTVTSTQSVNCIPANATVTGISVTFSVPDHTFVGDLSINLKSPNGTVMNLYRNLAATAGINIPYPNAGISNLTLSSASTTSLATTNTASQTGPITGTFKADILNGTTVAFYTLGDPPGYPSTATSWTPMYASPNGTWTLALTDDGAGDVGHLTGWSIKFDYIIGVQTSPATWSPAAGLFSNAGGTIPYIAGTPVDSVWAQPTPAGVYNYNVTVNGINPVPLFTNPAPITITDNAPANPSPATVVVSNLPTTGVTVKAVTITGFSHTWTGDVNIVLQNPAGTQNVILKGDSQADPAGNTSGANLTFSDAAAGSLPAGALATGTYKPTNRNGATFAFLPPGPTVTGPTFPASPTLATFTGNMNGTWKLFVEDRIGGDAGSIAGGFSIEFNDPTPPCTSPPRVVTVTVNTPVTVTTQPVNRTICTDGTTTFTVAATGSNISYQWQVSTNNGSTWTNISNGGVYSGATTNTLTITAPPVSLSGNLYRALVSGAAPCPAVPSFNALLTVNPLPTIVISASPLTALFPGLTTTLTSTVSPVAGVNFTWLRNGVGVAGATTGTLVVDVDGLGEYQLRVTDFNGCTNVSNKITIRDSVSTNCFLYPNPSNGKFQVRYYSVQGNVLPRSVTVYNSTGTRVFTQMFTVTAPYARMDVDLRAMGHGVYLVEIGDLNGNRISVCRAVVQ